MSCFTVKEKLPPTSASPMPALIAACSMASPPQLKDAANTWLPEKMVSITSASSMPPIKAGAPDTHRSCSECSRQVDQTDTSFYYRKDQPGVFSYCPLVQW